MIDPNRYAVGMPGGRVRCYYTSTLEDVQAQLQLGEVMIPSMAIVGASISTDGKTLILDPHVNA